MPAGWKSALSRERLIGILDGIPTDLDMTVVNLGAYVLRWWKRGRRVGSRRPGWTVTHLHNLHRFPASTPVKILMFLNTTSAAWSSLPAILLGKFGNFVVVKLLACLRSGWLVRRDGGLLLLAVRDPNGEQRNQPHGL